MKSLPSPRTFTHGFTLMEMLIALLVLSIGLLGLAGLQAQGLQNNHTAYLRTQATLLTYDIIDSMRANRAAAANGAYDVDLGDEVSGSSVADTDLAAWKKALGETLPDGDGSIEVTATGQRYAAEVLIKWKERESSSSDPQTQEFSWSTEL